MIRDALDGELNSLCDKISAIDPWKRLGIEAEAMAKALREDSHRRTRVWDSDGEVRGVISYRVTRCMEGLFNRNFGDKIADIFGLPWPCEWTEIPDGGYIRSLAVFRPGEGIGAHLLDYAELDSLRSGQGRMYLMVSEANPEAQRFYKRQGYRRVGSLYNCVREGNTEHLMEKALGK